MKERLTGAIILVALIVLLVPELLTGPIRTRSAPAATAIAAASPAVDEGAAHAQPPLRSYTLTLGSPPPAQPAAVLPAGSPASSGRPAPMASPSEAAVIPQQGAATEPTGLPAASATAHPAAPSGRPAASAAGWVVQLGSFASRRNAERLALSLERRGFRMSVSPARAGSRALWRVRAGPVRDRAAAAHLAARLRAHGQRGELLPVR